MSYRERLTMREAIMLISLVRKQKTNLFNRYYGSRKRLPSLYKLIYSIKGLDTTDPVRVNIDNLLFNPSSYEP